MNIRQQEQARQLTESLRRTDDLIDELTTGVIKQQTILKRRRLADFPSEQISTLNSLQSFSPYYHRTSQLSARLGEFSERTQFVRDNLSSLTAEEQAGLNALSLRSKAVMTEHIPSILTTSFFGSLIYAVATQPTMRSVASPVLKGTLLGLLCSLAYYRYDRQSYYRELSTYYGLIIERMNVRRRPQ